MKLVHTCLKLNILRINTFDKLWSRKERKRILGKSKLKDVVQLISPACRTPTVMVHLSPSSCWNKCIVVRRSARAHKNAVLCCNPRVISPQSMAATGSSEPKRRNHTTARNACASDWISLTGHRMQLHTAAAVIFSHFNGYYCIGEILERWDLGFLLGDQLVVLARTTTADTTKIMERLLDIV